MKLKNIIEEDFSNYKTCSMFIGFPHCSFKCEHECEVKMCQNSALVHAPTIEVDVAKIVDKYMNNPLSHALVCGGLEPFDDFADLLELIVEFRKHTEDEVIIYTGYNKQEIKHLIDQLRVFDNIIVKFGRFVPNQEKHFDSVLGVYLASTNQYAERI